MVNKKTQHIILLGALSAAVIFSFGYTSHIKNAKQEALVAAMEALRFSNTQVWDPTVYAIGKARPLLSDEARSMIQIPSPPANTSDVTTNELFALHRLSAERTEEKQAEIENEIMLADAQFGTHSLRAVTSSREYVETLIFLTQIYYSFTAEVVRQKELFDRVRPSILDSSLSITIDLPGHPSYPSGHASQSRLLALLFAELDPNNRSEYLKSAERTARNREIAGVHYRSDSVAGQELADQYFALLQNNEWYRTHLALAKEEWGN